MQELLDPVKDFSFYAQCNEKPWNGVRQGRIGFFKGLSVAL